MDSTPWSQKECDIKKVLLGVFATLASLSGIGAGAAMANSFYNYTDGVYCYVAYFGQGGCVVVDKFPCPREVGDD
ncbi:MAG: hypothetical protein ACK4GD_10375 [Sphingomonadaceae bacterium]